MRTNVRFPHSSLISDLLGINTEQDNDEIILQLIPYSIKFHEFIITYTIYVCIIEIHFLSLYLLIYGLCIIYDLFDFPFYG